MKKLLLTMLWSIYLLGSFIYADNLHKTEIINKSLTYQDFFIQYFDTLGENLPQSYKYIQLNYKNIEKNTPIYKSLQKWVFLGILWNETISLPLKKLATQRIIAQIIKKEQKTTIQYSSQELATTNRVNKILKNVQDQKRLETTNISFSIQEKIMQEVYNTISTSHINSDNINQKDLEYWAIKGMVNAVWDDYTMYFPPQEASAFKDTIEWEFEGIWAYIEMPKKWELTIITPLDNSPAKKAGIQAWDIITHINWKEITEDTSIVNAVSQIKWPVGSEVTLTIKRKEKSFNITLKREKIIIESVKLDNTFQIWTCYLEMKIFNSDIWASFTQGLKNLKKYNCNKYIFDVRNNPGWDLGEVNKILHHFVPTWSTNIIIKSKRNTQRFKSEKTDPKLLNKNIIILINKGSASASEIFAWTIKEYWGDRVVLIWEKTFWKGSVQEVINYVDWSSLKYTIAKRYTGKKEINVWHKWINPDILIVDDEKTEIDEQLEAAKKYRFKK